MLQLVELLLWASRFESVLIHQAIDYLQYVYRDIRMAYIKAIFVFFAAV
jgi:hypothetical protein